MAAPTPQPPGPAANPSPSPMNGAGASGGGIPNKLPPGTKIPPEIAEQIDNLPPGAETAIKLCQNPVVAAIASVALTSMGITASPADVQNAAGLASDAIDTRKAEKEQELNQGKSNTPSPR